MIFSSFTKDMFTDVLPIIKTVAPTVAGAIGGPIGMAASYIIPVLADAFGTGTGDINGLVNQIASDPDAVNKLQAIEAKHAGLLNVLMTSASKLTHAEINIKLDWAIEQK
jgi:hypothetical protein